MAEDGTSSGATYYREPQSYTRRQLKAKLLEQCAGRAAESVSRTLCWKPVEGVYFSRNFGLASLEKRLC
uniref:Uncharacterized protein n=1 Tax=Globodera pallida TaxID=36090 RepID=A0A183C8F7_GLOPA